MPRPRALVAQKPLGETAVTLAQGEELGTWRQSYKFIGFGAMDATKPYKFMGFGAMDVTKPYTVIRFGAMDVCFGLR